jgi:hypothetical protein
VCGVLANNGCIYCIPSGHRGSNQILKIDSINGTVTLLDAETGPGFWDSGALAIDGCIYFMPLNATHILKLNPENDSVASVGDDLGDVNGKYIGTVLSKDNCLYGIPDNSNRIVRFNPVDQSISFVGDESHDDIFNCVGNGALGRDGCIYALTHNGRRVLKIDVANSTYDSIVLRRDLQSELFGLVSAILGNDGCIYWPPGRVNNPQKFLPETKQSYLVGDEARGCFNCIGNGALGRDGCIYVLTHSGRRVLKIDVINNNYDSIVLEAVWQSQIFGLVSAILGNDGCIYWPPCEFNRALKFDPETNIGSLIGDDVGGETSITKWRSELAGPNGAIYCISYSATRVLVIDSFKEFAMGLQTNIKQYPQELGRLFPSSVPSESLASRKSLKSFRIAAFLPVLNVQVHVFHHSWWQRPLKIARCL